MDERIQQQLAEFRSSVQEWCRSRAGMAMTDEEFFTRVNDAAINVHVACAAEETKAHR